MKAIDRPFTKIINGTMQFVIPVFQRDYNWTEGNCEQLWKDLIRIAQDPTDRGHFLGSVVYVPTGDTAAGFIIKNVSDIKYTYDARRNFPAEMEQGGPRTWLQIKKGEYKLVRTQRVI